MRSKVMLALVFSLVISVSLFISANATQTRNNDVSYSLDFSNNVANCICEISTDAYSDWVSATMELWRGNTKLNSWSSSGTQNVCMDETQSVTRYRTYRLVINYSVNGIVQPSVETSRYYG